MIANATLLVIRTFFLVITKIIKKNYENAYKVELPGYYNVSATFNIADLSPYFEDEENVDSKVSLFQPGEHDTGVSH